MGTRNLTAVFIDGEYKVAQYGQWDGYPEGQGITCLHFLRDKMDTPKFLQAVRNCSFWEESDLSKLYELLNENGLFKKYPQFSRDTGADILELIQERGGIGLVNEIDFAADSLFCEWAWIVDFDAGTFEGYRGFNTERLTDCDRFYYLRNKCRDYDSNEDAYYGIKLAAKFDLDVLPTDEEFLAAFAANNKEEN